MDFKELAKNSDLEEEFFLELVRTFLKLCAFDLDNLQSSIDMGNIQKINEYAHSIKGAAINLGFKNISLAAVEIEKNASENRLDEAASFANIVKERYEEIERAFKTLRASKAG
ncbi:MAG: Hpt domain-containing protein [Thermodesulfobacteriota bacterium]|nr:Hpt domain-containing protein [Thermodesulfobacteriota bacterium]